MIKEPAACHVLLFETMDGPLDEVLENKSREGRLLLGEEGDLIITVGSLLSPGQKRMNPRMISWLHLVKKGQNYDPFSIFKNFKFYIRV